MSKYYLKMIIKIENSNYKGGHMKKYEKLMYHFSIEKLKSYAGKNYVDTLTEWIEDTTSINERTSLISIIKIIYGTKIFVNSNFRKDLLLSMTKEEIQKFAIDNGFDLKNYSDLRIFINEIAQKTMER